MMISSNLIVALDYELYFGTHTGTVERCMLEPTDYLVKSLSHTPFRLTLFVDAGCLIALKRSRNGGPLYKKIAHQLERLSRQGHDIQLHIHPHWEDSQFEDGAFQLNVDRYRLHDFPAAEISTIVKDYKQILEDITEKPVSAYRAGGWCLQPFDRIANALFENGVWIDSTVFAGGYSGDPGREFDFRTAPEDELWWFDDNPAEPSDNGRFLEIAITPALATPWLFVKGELFKRLSRSEYAGFGDGHYIAHNFDYYWSRLTRATMTPCSLDGGKAGLLTDCQKRVLKEGKRLLNVMGHPKALTPWSIKQLTNLVEETRPDCYTISTFASRLAEESSQRCVLSN